MPREVCGEHLTNRPLAVSSTLPRLSAPCRPGTRVLMLLVGDDWAEGHHDLQIVDDRGSWVAALVAARYEVFAINPLSVAHYRERHPTSGAESGAW